MSSGFSLDLTNPDTDVFYRLHSRIAQLSIELTTGMRHSRGSVLRSCQMEGFTNKSTKGGALVDCLTLAHVLNPEHEIADVHMRALLAWKNGDQGKTDAVVRKIKRDAAKVVKAVREQ